MHAHTHTVSMKMERVEMLADWTNTDNKLRKAQLQFSRKLTNSQGKKKVQRF